MYVTALSEPARRSLESLSDSRQAEFSVILDQLAEFLPAIQAAGFVRPMRFFGRDGFRYFDHVFPYLVFFELGITTFGFDIDVLLIHFILPA